MVAMAAARTVSDITLKGLIVKRFNHNEIRYLWLPFSYGKVLYLSPELPMCLCRKKPAFYIINHISFFLVGTSTIFILKMRTLRCREIIIPAQWQTAH